MKSLDPEYLKSSLVISSLFLTGHEMLKGVVVENLKGFICMNSKFNDDGELVHIENDDYREIKSKKHSQFNNQTHEYFSCCEWYAHRSILTSDELSSLQAIIRHRNRIAHDLPSFLLNDNMNLDIELLFKMQALLTKVRKYWFFEFEALIKPEFENTTIQEDDVAFPIISYMGFLVDLAQVEIQKLKKSDDAK